MIAEAAAAAVAAAVGVDGKFIGFISYYNGLIEPYIFL